MFCSYFRAISVLLGEKWKKMRSEERRVFTIQAKALADEQKRINPDCWKRKRTNSVIMLLCFFLSSLVELEMWPSPRIREKPGHTHAHTPLLSYFFMLSTFLYPPGLSGKLGMQTRRQKQPVWPADVLVHTFRRDKDLRVFSSLTVIFCTDTHLFFSEDPLLLQGPSLNL